MSYLKLRDFRDGKPIQHPRFCVHQGKYINGYYAGQLAKIQYAKELERPPGHPEDYRPYYQPKSPYQIQFDRLTLANYICHRRRDQQPFKGWYNETTYQRAFSLPFYRFELDQILATPVLEPKPLNSLPKLH
ncbi:protein SPMIP3 isoform X2 [Macrotis lagotis]|uniref:protein SPMIP3 isoform X2 n=1 Tax=Macrotis lagotis TaxID=92651 RepID=UPI003D682F7D